MKKQCNQNISQQTQKKLNSLRDSLNSHNIQGWIQPMNDSYFNEWLPDSEKRILWLSGFSGSAGTLLVSKEKAAIFTDSRYIIQAAKQVDTALLDILPQDQIVSWTINNFNENDIIGYDENHYTIDVIEQFTTSCNNSHIDLTPHHTNLIDGIWKDRPAPTVEPIWKLQNQFSGEESIEKQKRLMNILSDHDADFILISKPEAVCWLLNIRGNDIKHTPLVLSRGLFYLDGSIDLFLDPRKIQDQVISSAVDKVRIIAEGNLSLHLEKLGAQKKRAIFDQKSCPASLVNKYNNAGGNSISIEDPVSKMQSIKNETECAGARACQVRDGVALTKFLFWVNEFRKNGLINEYNAALKLGEFRKSQKHFLDLSFSALSATGPNAAMNHYIPEADTARDLLDGELYLIDSGGQYLDGTTDTTRTIALSEPTKKQVHAYTYVLKSHIALASSRFPQGTNGKVLDAITRAPMWKVGMDYGHGTGHGVGSCLNVHELPPAISYKADDTQFVPGMTVSNEPGFYVEGEFGIRIENMMIVTESDLVFEGKPFYQFETITRVPYDKNLIDVSLLTREEINWIDKYHDCVWKELNSYFKDEELIQLMAATSKLVIENNPKDGNKNNGR